MKAFDFDGTLYSGDSTLDFWLYALRNSPRCAAALPRQVAAALAFAGGRIKRDDFKERFYSFLPRIDDLDRLLSDFWRDSQSKIRMDVVEHANPGDVVVSASPSFLLEIPCMQLKMDLIASEVDPSTGKLKGPNCRSAKKVNRVKEAGIALPFDEFYTDSKTDTPLAMCSKRAFLVTKKSIVPFPATWLDDKMLYCEDSECSFG